MRVERKSKTELSSHLWRLVGEDNVEVVQHGVPVLHLPPAVLDGANGAWADAAGANRGVGILFPLQPLAHLVHSGSDVLEEVHRLEH